MDAENLLKNVDPSIEASDIIDQILMYSHMIKGEINDLRRKEEQEDNLNKQLKTKKKELEKIRASSRRVDSKQNTEMSQSAQNFRSKSNQNKPVLDYRAVIKNLENEVFYINQRYNDNKAKNESLMKELDELRKTVMISKGKHRGLNEKLKLKEKEFEEQNKSIKDPKRRILLISKDGEGNGRNRKKTKRAKDKERGNNKQNKTN